MEYIEEEVEQGSIWPTKVCPDSATDFLQGHGMVTIKDEAQDEETFAPDPESNHLNLNDPSIDKHTREATAALFDACQNADHLAVVQCRKNGADTLLLNDKGQYPLHVWCATAAKKIAFKVVNMNAFDAVMPPWDSTQQILNHYDNDGNTPYSIMLTHDVWVWSVKSGFFNDSKRPDLSKEWQEIHVRSSDITRQMKDRGANLCDAGPNGITAWHVLANVLYSNDPKKKVVGYSETTPIFILLAALILKKYVQDGGLNINQTDDLGRTGLDILVERYRTFDMNISDADFDVLMNYFEMLGCRRAEE